MGNLNDTAVFVKDAEGILVFANEAFARLLRRSGAGELLGKRSTDFFPAEAAAMLRREDEEILANLRQQAAALEADNAELSDNIASLGSIESVIRIAGEILGLIDPDSVIFAPDND